MMKAHSFFCLASFLSFVLLLNSNTLHAQMCEGDHSTSSDDAWQSCVETVNPNPDRSEGHWIRYDLGAYYELNQSHFWNYNVFGETARGVDNMVIDWSLDGTNWNFWGDINLEEAPGTENYFGETGPDFDGLVVRYLLLSVTSNHGGNCYGFSEIKLNVNPIVGCTGDIVLNGSIDISDVLFLLSEYGCLTECEADVDGDGAVSISDVLVVLAVFGQTC